MTEETAKTQILMLLSGLSKHRRQMLSMMEGFEMRVVELLKAVGQAERLGVDMEKLEQYVRAGLKGFGADSIIDIEELKGVFPSTLKSAKKKKEDD